MLEDPASGPVQKFLKKRGPGLAAESEEGRSKGVLEVILQTICRANT